MTKDCTDLFLHAAQRAARFRAKAEDMPQRPLKTYAEMVELFDAPLPDGPTEEMQVIETLADTAEQGLMMAAGPRFFGWVIGNSHPVGVAADFLTSAWGQNTGNLHAAPAAAAAEQIAARWLLELLDLPREASVGFATGATVANFVCLAAARGEVLRAVGWDADGQGLFGAPPISVVIGDDAHTTVFSALQFLGMGHGRVIRVATDSQGTILPEAFARTLSAINSPVIVVLQAGQLNTGAFDKFAQLIPLAKAKKAWVHVDCAFGLWARASDTTKHLAAGLDLADSWATDGHKWLQTPYDCGYAIVRNELAHRQAMTISASYLPMTAEGERDPTHYVPELSRRARGFPTWAIIRHLGRKGIAAMVERHCRMAQAMSKDLAAEPGIAIMNDVVLNQFIVRFGEDDELTLKTIARIQQDGVCFAGGAKWRGKQVMRVSVIGFETDETQAKISSEAIIAAWRVVKERG
jgi:glutamate/tyrosine decarboxylase-like PLP-dependent enzyme